MTPIVSADGGHRTASKTKAVAPRRSCFLIMQLITAGHPLNTEDSQWAETTPPKAEFTSGGAVARDGEKSSKAPTGAIAHAASVKLGHPVPLSKCRRSEERLAGNHVDVETRLLVVPVFVGEGR